MESDSVKSAKRIVDHMLERRSAREAKWRRLSKWICPSRGRFDSGGRDEPAVEELMLFTHAASSACLRGASGMTSGMTPRSASWFKPEFMDGQRIEETGARQWLDTVDKEMKDCLSSGGFYQAIQAFNMDLLWAGCALLYSEEAALSPLRFECCQIGTFAVERDKQGRLLAVARRMAYTVEELAEEFGEANLSRKAKANLRDKPFEPAHVWHLARWTGKGRLPVSSQFWEEGAEGFLRQKGFHEMPYFFTCWHEGNLPYGTGPGDSALADAMQMDELERRKLQGIARVTDPPMAAPTSLAGILDLSPGALSYVPDAALVRPLMDLTQFATTFGHLREEIMQVSERLSQALYASIFTSMPLDQRPRDMSATEFLERKREALQQLGPVISAYEPNVLTPLLYRVAQTLWRKGMLPAPPMASKGLGGSGGRGWAWVRMEFVSPMANALRQTSAEASRALFQDAAQMAQASQNPEILDKLDCDQMVDELARCLGAPGSIVRSDEDVAAIRRERQEAAQQREQMAAMEQMAQSAAAGGSALNQMAQAGAAMPQEEEGGLDLAALLNGGQA